MSHEQEILGPAIRTREEAAPLIADATSHFRIARRATIQVMADLRRLQDGQVHILYGYKNFSAWAAQTFPGLAPGNVRQLCRAGAVALELDRRKLIDLREPEGVGTTGLRELSTVAGTYGDDKMAEIFSVARKMIEPGEWVSATNVEAAMRLLMPPATPEPPIESEAIEQLIEEDEDPDHSPAVQELKDQITDLSWDLPDSLQDVLAACDRLAKLLESEKSDGQ